MCNGRQAQCYCILSIRGLFPRSLHVFMVRTAGLGDA